MAHLESNKTQDKRKVDFSICVSTYNSAKTLRVCLDSIFRQTVKPREVLVCDGGSKDETLDILKQYPVKIVATDVRGVGLARNVLASAASEKIIAWIDSDVAIPPNWLELRKKIHELESLEECCLDHLCRMFHLRTEYTPKNAPERMTEREESGEMALTGNRGLYRGNC